jgi:hypothetical protein
MVAVVSGAYPFVPVNFLQWLGISILAGWLKVEYLSNRTAVYLFDKFLFRNKSL